MGLTALLHAPPAEIAFRILLVDGQDEGLHRLIQHQAEGQLIEGCLEIVAADQQAAVKEYLQTHPEFDLILLNGAAEYLPDLATAIAEYRRILASYNPFGRLCVFMPPEVPYPRQDLTDRGASAVYSLEMRGWQEFSSDIHERWHPTRHVTSTPAILYDDGRPIDGERCDDEKLSDEERYGLQVLFPTSAQIRVSIHEGGYSDTRTFRVHTHEGQDFFVKVGRIDLLDREHTNFREFIDGRAPQFAVSLSRLRQLGLTGLLQSVTVGGAGGRTKLLKEFLIDGEIDEALAIIDEVFVQHQQLQQSLPRSHEGFRPHYYLRILPPLLVLKFHAFSTQVTPASEDKLFPAPEWDEERLPRHLRGFLAPPRNLTGRYILQNLYIEEVQRGTRGRPPTIQLTNEERWFKINVEEAPAEMIASPKLRYRKPVMLIGELKTHLPGIISTLLQDLFTPEEAGALGDFPMEWFLDLLLGIWPMAEADKIGPGSPNHQDILPNPESLPATERVLMSPLSRATNLVKGFTHGDFNLANILILEHTRGVTPWMIDYEKTRQDFYPACDWQKLEVELTLHVAGIDDIPFPLMLALERGLWLPPALHTAVGTTRTLAYPKTLDKYRAIVERIRAQAVPSLASSQIVDYLFGLVCHALSGGRFRNAPRAGRRLVYIKAITLLQAILNCLLREELQRERSAR